MIEKLSIRGKDFSEVAISAALTVGSGFPNWLVSALTIDFSFKRFMPPTSIFSTASSGVKIVASTRSNSEPIDAAEIASTTLLLRDAAVNLFTSGETRENSPLRFSDFLIFKRRLLSRFSAALGAELVADRGAESRGIFREFLAVDFEPTFDFDLAA